MRMSRYIALTLVAVALVSAVPVRLLAQSPVSSLQMKLATDAGFLQRVQYLLAQQARVVLTETGIGGTHAARATYAKSVLAAPAGQATVAAVVIVGGTNLLSPNATTTVNANGTVTTDATDAAILSQIATFWNQLAGIDSGS